MANQGSERPAQGGSGQVQPARQGTAVQRSGPASGWPTSRLPSLFGAWQEPFTAMRQAVEEMDAIFEGLVGAPARTGGRQGLPSMWAPQVEVTQKGDEMLVRAELPGISKEDVQVEMEDGRLVIRGERQQKRESDEGGFHRSEFAYGQFYRAVPLPEGADVDSASATVRDGVLEVRVKIPQSRTGRRIEVTEASAAGGGAQAGGGTTH